MQGVYHKQYEHSYRRHMVGFRPIRTVMNVFPATRPIVVLRFANTPRFGSVTLCRVILDPVLRLPTSEEFATLYSMRSSRNLTPSLSPPSLPTPPRFTI